MLSSPYRPGQESDRALNPAIRVVARCGGDSRTDLLGADAHAVVSPDPIGGLRTVSEMTRSAVVSSLDFTLRGAGRDLRCAEGLELRVSVDFIGPPAAREMAHALGPKGG